MEPRFDREKFKELALYVSLKCSEDKNFGATKLNKILWWSDFQAYARFGKPITGATYQKLPHGPAPKMMLPVLAELKESGAAVVAELNRYGKMQKRLVPLREADLSRFTASEIALVDEIIEALWERNATEVSDLSHEECIGWRIAEPNEEIPYATVFLSSRKATTYDIQRGQELAREHGWIADDTTTAVA